MGNGAGRSQGRIQAAEDKEVRKLKPYSSAQVLKHAGGEMRIHARSTQSEMAQKKARRRRRQPRQGGGQMEMGMGGGGQAMGDQDMPQHDQLNEPLVPVKIKGELVNDETKLKEHGEGFVTRARIARTPPEDQVRGPP